MTVAEAAKPTWRARPFSAVAWLVWAIIPVVPFSLVGLVEFDAVVTYGAPDSPDDGGPGLVIGLAIIIVLIMIVSVPVIGTLQWLILRRTWANPLLLPGWICGIFICVVTPLVFVRAPWAALIPIAFLPTVLLTFVSPPGLRFRALPILLSSFSIGAVLAWTMMENSWPNLRFLRLYEGTPGADFTLVEISLRFCVSIMVAAAVSGIGLWIVSKWVVNLVRP